MKNIDFRIIELPTHQVLVMKDFDEDEEKDLIVLIAFVNGAKVEYKLGFQKDSARDKAFDDIKDELAQKVVDSALEMTSQ